MCWRTMMSNIIKGNNYFQLLENKISNILNLFLICLKVAAVAANCESNVRIHLTGH